ncbi:hypothetical protein LWI28_021684 [Acer negundo]|uniref:Uncharacterized protein n=1 Tax=Acer negundo TaxID=4023 RepID=A0AAD5IDP8_ACENE|nr:hypothetical protein LWI28_021684 [Acer negundo]
MLATQTVPAQESEQASSSETPQTVTQVSTVGSFDKAPTFFSILFDVHTLLHNKTSSKLFSRRLPPLSLYSSALLFFIRGACPIITAVYMQHLMGIDGVIVALLQEITEAVSDMIMMKPSKVNEEERLEGDGKMEVKAKP